MSCKHLLPLAGSALPVTAYDKNGLRILLHFAKECPPGRPDVLVVVVSMLNTAPLPIKNIVLQAAVPKVPRWPFSSTNRGRDQHPLVAGEKSFSSRQILLGQAVGTRLTFQLILWRSIFYLLQPYRVVVASYCLRPRP